MIAGLDAVMLTVLTFSQKMKTITKNTKAKHAWLSAYLHDTVTED